MQSSANTNTEKMSGTRRCSEIIRLIDSVVEIEPIIIDEYQDKLDSLRDYSALAWWKVGAGEITTTECEQAITLFEDWVTGVARE